MAFTFTQMPAIQAPRTELNFEPLNRALTGYNAGHEQAADRNELLELGRAHIEKGARAAANAAFAQGRLDTGIGFQDRAQADEDRILKRFGTRAQQIDLVQDPQKRKAMWDNFLGYMKRESDARGWEGDFDPEELDPVNGPKLFMSQAGITHDPLERETREAQLAKLRAETSGLTRKSAMDDALMGMILGDGGGANVEYPGELSGYGSGQPNGKPGYGPSVPDSESAPLTQTPRGTPSFAPPQGGSAPMPGIILQNYRRGPSSPERLAVSPPPAGSPNVSGNELMQLVADLRPAPQPGLWPAQYAPQTEPYDQGGPAAPPRASGEDIVETPMGTMTRRKARQLAGAMLMDPSRAAMGREMLEASKVVGPGFTKPTMNAIQEKQFNTVEQFSRLKSIEQSWKPEYQQIENRLSFAWNNLMDKFGATRKSLTKQQRDELVAFHANRSEALNNLNQYIKEITGAAMTLPEAERIKRTMPNPGQGAFDGDGPTEFYSKLQANIRISKMALARYNYLTKRGFPNDVDAMSRELSLDDMPKLIQDRTNELLKESLNANPGLAPQDVAPIVRQRLRAEFGIDA